MQNEGSHVETLLDAARKCEQASPDAKAEALIERIYQLQADENEPDLKVLIFTEFVSTQEMLKEFLRLVESPWSLSTPHGHGGAQVGSGCLLQ